MRRLVRPLPFDFEGKCLFGRHRGKPDCSEDSTIALDIFLNRNMLVAVTRQAHPTDVFSAIAEPRRREVIAVLSDGQEHAVNEVVLRMRMAQPAVSKHLGALRNAGVVTMVKRGKHRMYRLNGDGLKPVHDWVKGFERYWTHQVDQIKQRAERKALERMIRLDDGLKQKEEE
jgi:DNA-binding transcriptional ArsR family regulator